MRTPRIFHPETIGSAQQVTLDADAANHVGRVLRLTVDAPIILFDGNGGEYPAKLIESGKKKVVAQIESFNDIDIESPLKIHLGQGVSRGDKMELTIQKAVELGATEITPLFTERCGVKLSGERLTKKLNQWRKIVIAACEQCGRNTVPTIHQPLGLSEWLAQESDELKLNLHPRASYSINSLPAPEHGIRLVIGPEGGLSDIEIEEASASGFDEVLIGPRVLRTETAGLTVISALQTRFGDLG
ncbi:16S rRNA (uracil(1498)-N(3))-methyltransferase [Psychrobium sp. 1_MG-2023]|uniref:16S rRNA (uracil(1498)-N(3))-methyltransferase n=1 Tax=Psychrobium sp. 1_MG-2023 TaxID=3062624 RepID=UPI000C33AC50|nr:16S rRNA (uracil(1498)-N(3))-methyltransferase [Psychrobium sp. 1_MG-2023]MDP2561115.1 16S rRNA (uracil(1498)-N(3))-methyltransferase [Psychrobium sp. 1_MG-2023]PKF55091.1 16S rRNA (uracil(1498)-N(3))-methyltransferase [Alteromonadales bacterium alter-6D02]